MASKRQRVALLVFIIALATMAAGFAAAQGTHPISGRVIAGVMGHEGVAWLERPEREAEEAPTKSSGKRVRMCPSGKSTS